MDDSVNLLLPKSRSLLCFQSGLSITASYIIDVCKSIQYVFDWKSCFIKWWGWSNKVLEMKGSLHLLMKKCYPIKMMLIIFTSCYSNYTPCKFFTPALTGVWVTVSLIRSPRLFSLFWPISPLLLPLLQGPLWLGFYYPSGSHKNI